MMALWLDLATIFFLAWTYTQGFRGTQGIYFNDVIVGVAGTNLLRKGSHKGHFVLNHFQGTNVVEYNTKGWLRTCRENPVARTVNVFLQDSHKWVHFYLHLISSLQIIFGFRTEFSSCNMLTWQEVFILSTEFRLRSIFSQTWTAGYSHCKNPTVTRVNHSEKTRHFCMLISWK